MQIEKFKQSRQKLLFKAVFDGASLNNPDSFNASQCWRHFQGTDKTGFTENDAAQPPLNVKPAIGGGVVGFAGYGINYINQVTVPAYPTNDLAGLESVFPTAIEDTVIGGVPYKTLKTRVLDSGPDRFLTQVWYTFYRYLQSGVPDLSEFFVRKMITLDDLNTLFSPTIAGKRYMVNFDVKTGSASGGDLRISQSFIMSQNNLSGSDYDEAGIAAGTIGVMAEIDNNANDTSIPTLRFVRQKNYTVPVPILEPFIMEYYFKRGQDYDDKTGRYVIKMKKADGKRYTLFDINHASVQSWNAANPLMPPGVFRTMGVYKRQIQRMFLDGIYFGGKNNQTITHKLHMCEIWDTYPDGWL